jgi:hypothetical protein
MLKDNYGRPRSDYTDRLGAMDDAALEAECANMVWLSAYANNNPRSDYHWQVDACSDECGKRGKPEIYKRGWNSAVRSAGHEHMATDDPAPAADE